MAEDKSVSRNQSVRNGLKLLRWTIAAAVAYVVIVAFTVVTAVNPSVIGTWFTIYEEYDGPQLVYKVEVRIADAVATTVRVAYIDLDIRVTNHHEFDVKVIEAFFKVCDSHKQRTSVYLSFADVTIGAGAIETFTVEHIKVVKVLGFGPRYQVQGFLEWYEVYSPSHSAGPFVKYFDEVHSVNEFIH